MPNLASRWCVGPAAAHSFVPSAPPPAAPAHPLRVAQEALARGDPAAALAAFERALRSEPALAVAHLGRAVCLARLGDEPAATAALDRALREPGAERVAVSLAAACARDGHPAFGMDILARVLDASPGLAPAIAADGRLSGFWDHPRFLQMVGKL